MMESIEEMESIEAKWNCHKNDLFNLDIKHYIKMKHDQRRFFGFPGVTFLVLL